MNHSLYITFLQRSTMLKVPRFGVSDALATLGLDKTASDDDNDEEIPLSDCSDKENGKAISSQQLL